MFQFLSFPPHSDAASLFFVSPLMPPDDPDSIFVHRNGAVGLKEAWVEGGPRLGAFLTELGAARCGAARLPNGREGERWTLGASSLIVLAQPMSPVPPRVVGAVLSTASPGKPPPDSEVLPGFWIHLAHQAH